MGFGSSMRCDSAFVNDCDAPPKCRASHEKSSGSTCKSQSSSFEHDVLHAYQQSGLDRHPMKITLIK